MYFSIPVGNLSWTSQCLQWKLKSIEVQESEYYQHEKVRPFEHQEEEK